MAVTAFCLDSTVSMVNVCYGNDSDGNPQCFDEERVTFTPANCASGKPRWFANETTLSQYVTEQTAAPFDFFNIPAPEGFVLSVAILSVWGSAFAVRALVRALDAADGPRE